MLKNNFLRFTISIIILGAVLVLPSLKTDVLMVVNGEGKLLLQDSLQNDSFVLGYKHSVLLTPVEEFFKISEGKLQLFKTIYESFGVGLPCTQEQDSDFEIKDGKFIYFIEREFEEISLYISQIPQHTLIIDGKTYDLFELLHKAEGSLTIYTVEKYVIKIGNHHIIIF
ncbi:MAG: DUF1850 domain-containing protein [Tissierellales bacterium]|nr:DUF1850 domain-containing protein [Tissierellales bacterium]MBN2827293.1 DUF1850 domain-containing protein [Tissierellales bacterium]